MMAMIGWSCNLENPFLETELNLCRAKCTLSDLALDDTQEKLLSHQKLNANLVIQRALVVYK